MSIYGNYIRIFSNAEKDAPCFRSITVCGKYVKRKAKELTTAIVNQCYEAVVFKLFAGGAL